MRALSVVTCLSAGLSSGCFSPTVPEGDTEASTDSQPSSSDTMGEDTTVGNAQTGPGTTSAPDGSSASGDRDTDSPSGPPSIELLLDGSDRPEAITDHALVLLTAEVQADAGVTSVEFFANDTLVGTDTETPFEQSDPLASDDSGLRTYRAVVVDGNGATDEDTVEVSINIAGGNLEALEDLGFTGALQARSLAVLAGGAVSTRDDSVFLSAITNTGGGRVSEFLSSQATGFELQWTHEFTNGVKSPVSPVGKELAVAVTAGGNWTVQLLDPATGQTNNAWTLGSAPSGELFGPQIASTGLALFGTTSQTGIARFNPDGTTDGWTEMTAVGAVFELATSNGDVLVSFGDILADAPASCATSSSYCLQKVTDTGSLQWVTGLSEQLSLNHRVAARPDGGAYAVSFVSEGDRGNGFEVTRVSPDGAILSQEHFGSAGSDDRADRAFDIDVSHDGSLVVCGTGSKVENNTFLQIPFVIRFDANLETTWDARDFLVDGEEGFGIACAVSNDAVAMYGLSDVAGGEAGGEEALLGTPWLARISL